MEIHPAQRADRHAHADRPDLRHADRQRRGSGGGVRLARSRQLRGALDPAVGLQRDHGLYAVRRGRVHLGEPRGRCRAGSAGPAGTMTTLRRLIRDHSALLGLIIIATLVLPAVFAYPLATFPHDVTNYDPPHRLLPPDSVYWLGTDRMGVDIYSRLLFGARLTILIAVVATSVSVLIGVPVGLV